MAQVETTPATGTKRRVHALPRIDMTPMVDLGFLLITFFIFTTSLAEKKTMPLVMPKEGDLTPLAESKALSVILGGNDRVYVYGGQWNEALRKGITSSSYDTYAGIGKIIREKQQELRAAGGEKEKDNLVLIIKPTTASSYRNLLAALDEAAINVVRKYAVVEPSAEESAYADTASGRP